MMIRGFQSGSGHERRKGEKRERESFLSSDITRDPSEGGMHCSRCGKPEKIAEEHGVAKINSKGCRF